MYKLFEHKHRFSAWAASRAASVIGCRFSVEDGQEILESIKNVPLPNNQIEFNDFHLKQRNCIISKAKLLIICIC